MYSVLQVKEVKELGFLKEERCKKGGIKSTIYFGT